FAHNFPLRLLCAANFPLSFCRGYTSPEAIGTAVGAVEHSSMHHATVGGEVKVLVATLFCGKLVQANLLKYPGIKDAMVQFLSIDNMREGIYVPYIWYKQYIYPHLTSSDVREYLSGRRKMKVQVYTTTNPYLFARNKLDPAKSVMENLGFTQRADTSFVLGQTNGKDVCWRNLVSRFGLAVGCSVIVYWDVQAATLVLGVVRKQP
ncbi:hypothetical protein MKW98_017319, partial [Papaver atlanticum]